MKRAIQYLLIHSFLTKLPRTYFCCLSPRTLDWYLPDIPWQSGNQIWYKYDTGPATGKKKQLNELINNTIFYLLDSLLCSSSSCIHSSCICYNTNGAFFSECYNQIPSLPLKKPEKKGELMRSMDVDYSDFRSP